MTSKTSPTARRTLPLLVLALVLAVAAVAGADRGGAPDPKRDTVGPYPRNTNPADVDLVHVSWGHARKPGMLVHRVSVRGTAPRPIDDLDQEAKLFINLPNGGPGCEFRVVTVQGERDDGQVLRCTPGGPRVGGADIRRLDRNTLRFVFHRSSIGSPRLYRWFFAMRRTKRQLYDRAPDRGTLLTHRIG